MFKEEEQSSTATAQENAEGLHATHIVCNAVYVAVPLGPRCSLAVRPLLPCLLHDLQASRCPTVRAWASEPAATTQRKGGGNTRLHRDVKLALA